MNALIDMREHLPLDNVDSLVVGFCQGRFRKSSEMEDASTWARHIEKLSLIIGQR